MNPNMEMDRVYNPAGTTEFKNIHLSMCIESSKLLVTIFSDEVISHEDLECIITDLQKESLDKMRISVSEDCDFSMAVGNETFRILLAEGGTKVSALERSGGSPPKEQRS